IVWRGRGSRGAERCGKCRIGLCKHRDHQGLLGCNTERTTDSLTGARRQLGEILATVVVHSKARANHEVLEERGRPRRAYPRAKTPLPSSQCRSAHTFTAKRLIVASH